MTSFATTSSAQAQQYDEPWFVTADVGATGAMNSPITTLFHPGFTGAAGVYRSFMPELALGVRARAGFLSTGDTIPQDTSDRGALDFGLIAPALRIRPLGSLYDAHHDPRRATSLWLEVAPGGALVDGHVIPAYELGIGYNFPAGPIAIGPMFRFTHLIETEGRFGDHHIAMWTGGVEVAFMDEATRIAEPAPIVAREPLPEPEPVAEPANPYTEDVLAIDERVFFDFDRADLRSEGKDELDRVIAHYQEYSDRIEVLEVSGHADERGSEPYNEELSQRRAAAVMEYLSSRGVPAEAIEMQAWGELRPAVPNAQTEAEHQINRRVEFHVVWRDGQRPDNVVAGTPTLPEYTDPAPAARGDRSSQN